MAAIIALNRLVQDSRFIKTRSATSLTKKGMIYKRFPVSLTIRPRDRLPRELQGVDESERGKRA
jgi:hypothetical protein